MVAEHREGNFNKVTEQIIAKTRELADGLGQPLCLAILGSEEDEKLLEKISGRGIDKCYFASHKLLADYDTGTYKKVLNELIKELKPLMVFGGATSLGRDLFPRLAARLDVDFVPDVIDIKIDNGKIVLKRTMQSGRIYADLEVHTQTEDRQAPVVLTVLSGISSTSVANDTRQTEIIKIEPELSEADLHVRFIEIVKSEGKIPLFDAEVIISGGRGMGNSKNFGDLENLTDWFRKKGKKASVGASRRVVDPPLRWRDYSDQVGLTGNKDLTPELYIACGISGAFQHLVGMRRSKCIIAINIDLQAPIFKVADYGIVGNVLEILPLLTKELQTQTQAKK